MLVHDFLSHFHQIGPAVPLLLWLPNAFAQSQGQSRTLKFSVRKLRRSDAMPRDDPSILCQNIIFDNISEKKSGFTRNDDESIELMENQCYSAAVFLISLLFADDQRLLLHNSTLRKKCATFLKKFFNPQKIQFVSCKTMENGRRRITLGNMIFKRRAIRLQTPILQLYISKRRSSRVMMNLLTKNNGNFTYCCIWQIPIIISISPVRT